MFPSWLSSLGLVLLLPLLADAGAFNIAGMDSPDRIENSFIAVFNSSASESDVTKCRDSMVAKMRRRSLEKRNNETEGEHTYIAMGRFRAMTCETDAETVAEMQEEAGSTIAWVEAVMPVSMPESAEQIASASAVQRLAVNDQDPNRLNLVDKADVGQPAPADNVQGQGQGTTIYVMDTGCNDHVVYTGRARRAANFVRGENAADNNGHGTHTAGSAAGDGTGTAPKAGIACVKILNGQGSGDTRAILGGFQFVMRDATPGKCVVNLSLASSKSQAVNQAADTLGQMCAVCVAAGNDGKDASTRSPASAPGVITVGATDSTTGQLASFSNFGPDVDINAPGVNVLSADSLNPQGLKALSGTSMACPQVAGRCADVLSTQQQSCVPNCSQVCLEQLQGVAAKDAPVSNVPPGTSDLEVDTTSQVPIAKARGARRRRR
ncbi:hypothetical protein XA68_16244 [Ophiocordyceps unilateralis]|uniref:Peptidase S8/S53 domain-containing protein n=1 Tax=Ophiocordyceps unilateralis TaxID=268505 RepID=A0A2A9P5L2_OPHUN|nr:hypothetical protein XA68_16244 [Ophiocordyceps unilateralis]